MEFEERKKIRMHLDIAPLIDIVFLLLIFFMLTAHFIVQPGIEITLPTAKAAEPREAEDIIISITKENEIFLNDKWIDISELKDSLEEKLELSSKKTVILKADEKINLGLAVKIMDIAKQANAEELVISTKIVHQGIIEHQ
ncbi:biopolymer transporter ExbD [candidate division NPL-UPA2 bacterium Unc8]|uniref:Biopolymer transporter ExbD n=1 Tax=candidate division NPL-UPA2 bacterium Unc8 TaxID=1980939 RepID=A0A399FXG5_UNCN2|nr:Biopolymer transport protein ExbD [Bacillota bacterium]MBT9147561.1 Biopolymer transport protein ExbD [Bacillota bacterium]RII00109.1 MAG: biopolymer transporter ExbD [candidate division NPL-UPA2 bacterium Unc8]